MVRLPLAKLMAFAPLVFNCPLACAEQASLR